MAITRLTQLQRYNGIGSKRPGINTIYRDKELIPAGANDITPPVAAASAPRGEQNTESAKDVHTE